MLFLDCGTKNILERREKSPLLIMQGELWDDEIEIFIQQSKKTIRFFEKTEIAIATIDSVFLALVFAYDETLFSKLAVSFSIFSFLLEYKTGLFKSKVCAIENRDKLNGEIVEFYKKNLVSYYELGCVSVLTALGITQCLEFGSSFSHDLKGHESHATAPIYLMFALCSFTAAANTLGFRFYRESERISSALTVYTAVQGIVTTIFAELLMSENKALIGAFVGAWSMGYMALLISLKRNTEGLNHSFFIAEAAFFLLTSYGVSSTIFGSIVGHTNITVAATGLSFVAMRILRCFINQKLEKLAEHRFISLPQSSPASSSASSDETRLDIDDSPSDEEKSNTADVNGDELNEEKLDIDDSPSDEQESDTADVDSSDSDTYYSAQSSLSPPSSLPEEPVLEDDGSGLGFSP